MPKIPDAYDLGARPTPQSDRRVIGYDVDPLVQGGQAIARAVSSAGRDITAAVSQVEARRDETDVLDARGQIAQKNIEIANGARQKLGKEALEGLEQSTSDELKNFTSEVEAKMRSPRAKAMLRDFALSQRLSLLQTVAGHVSQQREKYDEEVFSGNIASNVQATVTNPAAAAQNADSTRMLVEGRLRSRGMSDEKTIAAAVAQQVANVHAAAVQGYIASGDNAGAIAYFDANQDGFADKKDNVASAIKQARYAIQETEIADQLISKYGAGQSAIDAAAALQKSGKIDETLRERVESRIDRQAAREARIEAQGQKALRQFAFGAIDKADPTTPLTDLFNAEQMAQIAAQPGLWEVLKDQQQKRLRNENGETDPRVKAQLEAMLPSRDKFLDFDLSTVRGGLSRTDYVDWHNKQVAAADETAHAQILSETETLKVAYDRMGIAQGDKSNKRKRDEFLTLYTARKAAWKAAHGNVEPGTTEVRQIMAPLMAEFAAKDRLPQLEARGFDLPASRIRIPGTDRVQIVEAWKAKYGIEPTESQVLDLYKRAKR